MSQDIEEKVAEIVSRLGDKHLRVLSLIHRRKGQMPFGTLAIIQHHWPEAWEDIQKMKLCSIIGIEFTFSTFGAKVASVADACLEIRGRLVADA